MPLCHLPDIPHPGHTDGMQVEAGDVINQQEQSWTRCAGEDCGHGKLWGARGRRVGDIPWSLGTAGLMLGKGLLKEEMVSGSRLAHTAG